MAHIKHAAGFGQGYYGGLAHGNGFDELVRRGGRRHLRRIYHQHGSSMAKRSSGPTRLHLLGIMMQVLQRELDRERLAWRHEPVHVADLASWDGAFVTNSHGIATVSRIDDLSLPTDARLMRIAEQLLADAPYDPI